MTKSLGIGRGGARKGAGGPKKPLLAHVRERSFRAGRHSALLESDRSLLEHFIYDDDPDLPTWKRLAAIQLRFQAAPTAVRSHLARIFEEEVRTAVFS